MSQRIVLTTTATVPNKEIKEVVDIVSAEVAGHEYFQRHVFRSTRCCRGAQALFRIRLEICEARRWKSFVESIRVGADAVVGVDLDYSEFSGGGRSMLFIVANGTAVKLQ